MEARESTGLLQCIMLQNFIIYMLLFFQAHREACMCNHTATHIINYALSKVFPNVYQKGSTVTSDRLTFDFNCLVCLVFVFSLLVHEMSTSK